MNFIKRSFKNQRKKRKVKFISFIGFKNRNFYFQSVQLQTLDIDQPLATFFKVIQVNLQDLLI